MKKIIGISILILTIVANTTFFSETNNDDSNLNLANILSHANAQGWPPNWGGGEDDGDDSNPEGEVETPIRVACQDIGVSGWNMHIEYDWQDGTECIWTMDPDLTCVADNPCD